MLDVIDRYKFYIEAAVFAVVSFSIILLASGLYHYHKVYIEQVAAVEVLKEKEQGYIRIIEENADKVKKLKEASDSREQAAKDAIEKAKVKHKVIIKKAQTILSIKPATDDLCFSSNELFNQYLKGDLK
jgi:hypothetical protein